MITLCLHIVLNQLSYLLLIQAYPFYIIRRIVHVNVHR